MKGIVRIENDQRVLIVEDDEEYCDYLFEPGETKGTAKRRSDGAIVEIEITGWKPILGIQ